MKKLHLASILLATSLAAFGCSSSGDDTTSPPADTGSDETTVPTDTGTKDSTVTDTGTTDTGTPDTTVTPDTPADTGPPAPPTLGAQIDRMGRPAVNTATNHAFDPNDTTKGAAKDKYNQAAPADWATFIPQIEANLAILDALDTNCGNQFGADKTKTDATRYQTLAGVLANDRLFVNTAEATCTGYLAVEAGTLLGVPVHDCGGRKPSYEVMKISYNTLTVGDPTATTVTDGVAITDRSKLATFPYMVAPH